MCIKSVTTGMSSDSPTEKKLSEKLTLKRISLGSKLIRSLIHKIGTEGHYHLYLIVVKVKVYMKIVYCFYSSE